MKFLCALSVPWARFLTPPASVSSPVKWDGSDATWEEQVD